MSIDDSKIQILHEHYKETAALLQSYRQTRDRQFYMTLATIAVVMFDAYTPRDFATVLSDVLKKALDTPAAPNLSYVRTLIWFLLLGVTVRYCQTVVLMERQYKYIHTLEVQLATHFKGVTFTREGKAYNEQYPAFAAWAHFLYTLVFPAAMLWVVAVRTVRQLPGWPPWSTLTWLDFFIGIAICATLALYLLAVHDWRPRGGGVKT
jgi:hypothetical protein